MSDRIHPPIPVEAVDLEPSPDEATDDAVRRPDRPAEEFPTDDQEPG